VENAQKEKNNLNSNEKLNENNSNNIENVNNTNEIKSEEKQEINGQNNVNGQEEDSQKEEGQINSVENNKWSEAELNALTVEKLKEELNMRKINYSKSAKKKDLIELLLNTNK